MSMRVGARNSNVTKLTLRNRNGSVAGTISVSKPAKKKPKRLQYNFKEISTLIMQTKTPSNARKAVSKAFIKLMGLRTKMRTGEYDDQEVQSAIIHAQKLVRIAKKRMKHLQEEESASKKGGVCEGDLEDETTEIDLEALDETDDTEVSEEELKQLMQELEQNMEELEQAIMEESNLDDLSDELMPTESRNLDPEDLELLKKNHRAEELRDIMEADLKYLKAMFDKLAKEKQENSSHSGNSSNSSEGVSLELGGMEVPVEVTPAPMTAEGEHVNLMA